MALIGKASVHSLFIELQGKNCAWTHWRCLQMTWFCPHCTHQEGSVQDTSPAASKHRVWRLWGNKLANFSRVGHMLFHIEVSCPSTALLTCHESYADQIACSYASQCAWLTVYMRNLSMALAALSLSTKEPKCRLVPSWRTPCLEPLCAHLYASNPPEDRHEYMYTLVMKEQCLHCQCRCQHQIEQMICIKL